MKINKTFLCCIVISMIFLVGCTTAQQKQQQQQQADILKYRTGFLTIKTTPGAIVKVNQLRHEFPFGTAINHEVFEENFGSEKRQKFLDIVKDNYNWTVPSRSLKWPECEPKQGQISYDEAETILKWSQENGMPMRGHCIFWAKPKHIQQWVKDLDDKALEAAIKKRIFDLLTHFKGRIGEYDVNNEMIHEHYYAERLGEQINVKMFQWAHQADPNAILYVNDFKVLTGDDTEKYIKHISQLIKAGAPVGGIGCQGHFTEKLTVKPESVKMKLDQLAQFGLPIKVTEFDMDIPDEQLKAKWIKEFYQTCFAHPAVSGILMWGFYRPLHWRPKGALWEADFSPTPAAVAYHDLIYRQWWTKEQVKADSDGICTVRVFYGKHLVESNGKKVEVFLGKKQGQKTIDLN